ncbi:MAG: histidine phosphatase family protein, partial [Bacteroidales bacterium]|nr:histidine phosphatase family protein [Bacteroidales bacterium]
MQITLVRHTAVSPEWQVICYGNTDIPLADTFDVEAPRVAAQIDLSLYDRILSSPLSRALKLAQHCVPQGTKIEIDDRLKEMNFGD